MTEKESGQQVKNYDGKQAMQLILLLGLVSALGDITYESGRSVSGPYLLLLGASAGVVGLVSGLGEFAGYALRLVSGYLADRTRTYWLATFIGYGLLISIPILAYTDRWEIAALLLILERVGKAIRSPARDTILSYATRQTGRGWGFAIHEALDQVGAVIGPLLFTAAYLARGSYRDGFSSLWIPAILTLVALIIARLRVPTPEKLETTKTTEDAQPNKTPLPPAFWIYSAFTFLSVAGFANFQIISFHFATQEILPLGYIPILYAGAMGVDAVAALVVGKSYDRFGLKSLIIIPFATLLLPIFNLSRQIPLILFGVILWGIVMATHETVMRASIADLIPKGRRAFAYGIFNTLYGGAWFLGSTALGFLYDLNPIFLIGFVAVVEAAAFGIFFVLQRAIKTASSA